MPVDTTGASSEQPPLLRVLGLWQATAIVMGVMIGSAIFIVPAEITREVGGRQGALWVWLLSGLLSLLGALSFAELAGMLPQAGGQYIYLREAYGSLVSFLCGWAFFLIVQTGSISAVAVGFAEYLADFIPLSPVWQKLAACAAILLLTAINYRGAREGGWVQSVLTGLKVGAIVALVALGFWLVRGSAAGLALQATPPVRGFLPSFGVAMVAALWAYDGWNNVTFVAGEVKNPGRTLPLALIFGTAGVLAIYIGLNLAYYHMLPLPDIVRSTRVASDAAVRMLGRSGARWITLTIIVSMVGSANGMVLAGARVYYAMAKDGLFFHWCGQVHPRFRTPHLALTLQCFWAICLVLVGTYQQLFTCVIFAGWIFYGLSVYAVIVLRRKCPDLPRPFRVGGYPLVPMVFVLGATWVIANMLVEKPIEAGIGGLMIVLGVPVYWLWRR